MDIADDPGSAGPLPRRIATVARAIAVLEALAESSPTDLGTNEIARRTGVNASSVSRLLATLAQGGLVTRVDDTGRYRLGLKLVDLGNTVLARLDVRDVARPHLVELSAATGETATLSVPGETEAVTVDFVQGRSSVQSVARLGRPSVAHATAVGKVFLAHGGHLPGGRLAAYTQHTVTDRDLLAREVADTAERGWGEVVGEREDELNAVAVPLLDGRGGLVAILGLQGPAGRFDRAAMAAAVDALRDHARQIRVP